MMTRLASLLFLQLVLLTTTPTVHAEEECNQCFFVSTDPSDCRVYGKLDGTLVSWSPASADCLDVYDLKNTGIDPFSVGCEVPYSANTFVNAGLSGGSIPNTVLAGLGVSEGGFFELQGVSYKLKDSITINGESYNCKAKASDCYNAMKTYFASGDGADEQDDVCSTVLSKLALDREIEQSDARNRICQDIKNDVALPTSECGDLVNQVQSAVSDFPDKICPGFAIGPGTTVAPGCEGRVNANNNNNSSGGWQRNVSHVVSVVGMVVGAILY